MAVLRAGGNAVDAAIAAAAVTAVLFPAMNGLGGDAFLMVYDAASSTVHALNGSGPAPRRLDPAAWQGDRMTLRDARTVCVPGAVGAWAAALGRFGTWPLARVLGDGIALAEDGFPVSPRLADHFARHGGALRQPAGGALFATAAGSWPRAGADVLRQPALADTLRAIAADGPSAFYLGTAARSLSAAVYAQGGWLAAEDLADYRPAWKEPLRLGIGDELEIVEQPPVSQGVLLLAELLLARSLDLGALEPGDPDLVHRMVSTVRLAFADRDACVGEGAATLAPLLDADRAAGRAATIGWEALPTEHAAPAGRDTEALVTVDAAGNAVCLIQSLFHAFGSGIVDPGTGVVLNNRGWGFSTRDPAGPNYPAPGRRPRHTLHTCMLLQGGKPVLLMASPGGDGQVQTHFQVLTAILEHSRALQEAVEAPRWYDDPSTGELVIEDRFGKTVLDDLQMRGYRLRVDGAWSGSTGSFHVAARLPNNHGWRLVADPRQEGAASGY